MSSCKHLTMWFLIISYSPSQESYREKHTVNNEDGLLTIPLQLLNIFHVHICRFTFVCNAFLPFLYWCLGCTYKSLQCLDLVWTAKKKKSDTVLQGTSFYTLLISRMDKFGCFIILSTLVLS